MHQITGTSPDVMMMLLADARLPTGGHTQSAGLEPALRAGMAPRDVPAYIAARLATTARVEAGTAVVARHVALQHSDIQHSDIPHSDLQHGDLAHVRAAWAARTPSPALRETSERLGRGYLRLVRRLWADHAALAALERDLPSRGRPPGGPAAGPQRVLGGVPRPVVLGVLAACSGLDAGRLARLVAYDDAQTVAAASLKLEPVDPADVTAWVLAAGPDIDDLVREVEDLTHPDQIPAHGAPLMEQWAEHHARTTERLFSA
ncbi:urease accessory protein UreF [Sanguibacter antarcticus]|uniref:Urease accessory protein n=1 Tax=Sanguibacter antarcticus TaxID=372484 RepID=A0A2A9E1F1_9MICO|nr:urease accessory UreF family protein [Sanguibacter antarcticus]PFG32195.1 urease accessory protein [Sanguibacter antarcticus]PFG35313.1 urease accessory protein [Sanguibacter antarcticus]